MSRERAISGSETFHSDGRTRNANRSVPLACKGAAGFPARSIRASVPGILLLQVASLPDTLEAPHSSRGLVGNGSRRAAIARVVERHPWLWVMLPKRFQRGHYGGIDEPMLFQRAAGILDGDE